MKDPIARTGRVGHVAPQFLVTTVRRLVIKPKLSKWSHKIESDMIIDRLAES